jgi:DNA replication protein DnaC
MKSAQEILNGLKFEASARDREIDELERKRGEESRKMIQNLRLERIPKRYAEATFESFQVSNSIQAEVIKFLKTGRSCIIFGPNGTGKTHLAFSAIKYQIYQDRDAWYTLAADYFDLIRKSFSQPEPELKNYESCDYLVIDEVDKAYGSQTEFIALYRLINHRYNDMKPTVLITNSNQGELVDVIGSSTFDRIREDGKVFLLNGESWRKRTA